jgi:WD40 repeat protein
VPISTIALQVYHSVLVFMPDCPLFKRVSTSAAPIARMITDRQSTWNPPVIQSAIGLDGHTGDVLFVVFSADGSCIVSCSHDRTARIWDASSGEPKTVFAEHETCVCAAAFSPAGQTVTSIDDAGYIYTWDITTGLTKGSVCTTGRADHGSEDSYSLVYSGDGARIISSSTSTVSFIDVATHQLLRVLHLPSPRTGLSRQSPYLSADGSRLYMQCRDDRHATHADLVEIWDTRDETDLSHRTDLGPIHHNSPFALSVDGRRAVFQDDARVLKIVEFLQDGNFCISTIDELDYCTIQAISSSARASVVGPSVEGDDMLLVDLSSKPPAIPQMTTLGQYPSTAFSCAAFSPDGARVVAGSEVGIVYIWNTESGRPYNSSLSRPPGSPAMVDKIHLSRDGLQVICLYEDGLIEIHSTIVGNLVTSFNPCRTELKPDTYRYIGLVSSPDSLRLAFWKGDSSGLYIWDLQAGSIIASLQSRPLKSPVWSLDSAWCAVNVDGGDRMHVLEVRNGSVRADLGFPGLFYPGRDIHLHHAEFSSNGGHLLLIFREGIWNKRGYCQWTQHTCLWSTNNWSLQSFTVSHSLSTMPREPLIVLDGKFSAFSSNGTHLIIYSSQEKLVHLRGIGDEGTICSDVCEGNTRAQEVMWSQDGSKVALIDDYEVLVWSTACSTASCHLTMIFRLDMSRMNAILPGHRVTFCADSLRMVISPALYKMRYSHFHLPTLNDATIRLGVVTENTSVDIIVDETPGWLCCSRADRADLVPLLWVPLARRWGDKRDVEIIGSKVAFRSASGEFVTVLDFPSLRDLYHLFEPNHDP